MVLCGCASTQYVLNEISELNFEQVGEPELHSIKYKVTKKDPNKKWPRNFSFYADFYLNNNRNQLLRYDEE